MNQKPQQILSLSASKEQKLKSEIFLKKLQWEREKIKNQQEQIPDRKVRERERVLERESGERGLREVRSETP